MKKGLCLFVICLIFLSSSTLNVYADNYTITNDGKEKGADDIYKDSGLPSSFKDAEYYDVAMPYNLSAFDVGGWCSDAANKDYVLSEEKLKSIKISANVCKEFSYEKSIEYCKSSWGTISYDSNTGCTVIESNGTKFFVMAVQKFQFNNSTANSWFGGFSSSSNGNLIDVVLTDGTVIHFIKGDSNAAQHTNGGETGNGQVGATDSNSNYEGQWWTFEPAKLKQYANIYGLSSCNSIEIWGDSSKFTQYYNLGSGEDNNRIAYYRVYNLKASDSFTPVDDGVKSVSYKLGNLTLADGSVSEGLDLVQTGKYSESHFMNVANLVEEPLVMPDRDTLTQEQLKGVVDWKNNVDYENEGFFIKALRVVVMFFGIIFLVWIILIYLAYWFDRINNFIDIDILPILTGGRLRVSPEENECTFNPKNFTKGQAQTVNHKVVLIICSIGIFFSVLIISGTIYSLIGFLVKKMLSVLGV